MPAEKITFESELYTTEIINGREYSMARPMLKHIRVSHRIGTMFENFLQGKRCQVLPETTVLFQEDENEFVPDISIVCDPSKLKPDHIEGAPDLIVEVLSPSTRKRDITVKKELYEKYGVKEYWIVSPQEQTIDVYLLDENGVLTIVASYGTISDFLYKRMKDDEKAEFKFEFSPSMFPEMILNVNDIFKGIENL